jgi:hypothetical protein
MDTINQGATVKQASESERGIESTDNTYWGELARDLEVLERTPEFKRVILEGYFKDKAVMGVSLLATDAVKQAGARSDIMENLIAISSLEDHFKTIRTMGMYAQQDAEEFEEEE